MAIMAQVPLEGGIPGIDMIDLESGHKVIAALMEVLQENFKRDRNYKRPMMSPQANIVFALDREIAFQMADYMASQLTEVGGFTRGEFRFTHKTGGNGEILQRLRLEFPEGLNALVIRRLITATARLRTQLPPF